MTKKRLGRGLSDLIGKKPIPQPITPNVSRETIPNISHNNSTTTTIIINLDINSIIPNKFQPRETFDEIELDSLKKSISQNGILQPIIVRPSGSKYELIAGERRFRASKELGRKTIPAIERNEDDSRSLRLALAENLHRRDLNPIEKAKGFKQLINEFNFTHDEVSAYMGMSRSSITNFLRLLDLPGPIQELVSRETISYGHARALLSVENEDEQARLCGRIVKEGLSVRELERIIKAKRKSPSTKKGGSISKSPQILQLEDKLRGYLGTKVMISHSKKNRGAIKIEYYSNKDFDRIYRLIMGEDASD